VLFAARRSAPIDVLSRGLCAKRVKCWGHHRPINNHVLWPGRLFALSFFWQQEKIDVRVSMVHVFVLGRCASAFVFPIFNRIVYANSRVKVIVSPILKHGLRSLSIERVLWC